MRSTFLDLLYESMDKDDSLFFLTADMGINLVERFEETYPNRYLNVGIAEQNLVGIAAGLAQSGMRPYIYTISNFLIHRAFEQIRNDLVLHSLPVTLIGTSTGYDNGPLGPTHHMLEDWGLVSALPNVSILAPYSKESARKAFEKTLSSASVSYVRIAKGDGIPDGVSVSKNEGSDTCIVSYGSAAPKAFELAEVNGFRFMPLLELGSGSFRALDQMPEKVKKIIIIEDHFSNIGMFSYICQWKVLRNSGVQIVSISPKEYSLKVGHTFEEFVDFSSITAD